MKRIGLISTVVDELVDKGIYAGGCGDFVTGLLVRWAPGGSADVWKTTGVFASKETVS